MTIISMTGLARTRAAVTGSLLLFCILGFAFGPVRVAAAGTVPTTQTFKPSRLGISFALPSDWAGGATGLRFDADGPGRVAHLHVVAAATRLPLATVIANFIKVTRLQLAKADPHGSITERKTSVGGVPAVQLTMRHHGLWVDRAGEIIDLMYGFEHHGFFYLFDYSTTSDWLSKERLSFSTSIKSLRFVHVA